MLYFLLSTQKPNDSLHNYESIFSTKNICQLFDSFSFSPFFWLIKRHSKHMWSPDSETEHASMPIKSSESKYSHCVTPGGIWDPISPVTGRECGTPHWVTEALGWLLLHCTVECRVHADHLQQNTHITHLQQLYIMYDFNFKSKPTLHCGV